MTGPQGMGPLHSFAFVTPTGGAVGSTNFPSAHGSSQTLMIGLRSN